MNLTLSVPRSRPEHLAGIPAPEGCGSPFLKLSGAGVERLAERDPSGKLYHAHLPALSAGEEVVFEAQESETGDSAPGLSVSQEPGKVGVGLQDAPFMTFWYGEDFPKPVINPILTPGGENMLREPMPAWSEGEHPWQRGLTLMQGAINGVDCWNERDRETFGRTEQDGIQVIHGPISAVIASQNSWYQDDLKLMTDTRSYRLFETPRDAAILDIELNLKASEGPVTIGDTKEGGFLCIRLNPTMNASADGQMRNAYGATDEQGCWSLPSHWMDYYGPVGGEEAGFAIFDHPENFRYPTTWHVRGYGLFAPNCWMFKPDHALAKGESLTFRWRVTVHAGDTQQADIANGFLDYVDGPRVTWS